MHDFAYGDRRMHMGIPVCKRAGIAENFAYGDPITHNEIVRIRGLTYIYISRRKAEGFTRRHSVVVHVLCEIIPS